jgi:hypothetical protein
VYVAAHGEQGGRARDNFVALWSGQSLSVGELARLHDQHARPLRLIIASCFSGGFGDLAFVDADPKQGASRASRCGVFAGTWDRETSGCDPNPDRREQEGYSLHMLHALRGQDRHGAALPIAELDHDGDGRISLLEAHTRARIASMSIDVPTTTSERFLREVARGTGAINAQLLPEDASVVKRLGERLALPTEALARQELAELEDTLDDLDRQLSEAEAVLDARHAELAGLILARFPVLDDAYHPDFAATLREHAADIEGVLEQSAAATQYAKARTEVEALDGRFGQHHVREAVVTRLVRAYETLHLASALAARGGAAYAQYQSLLACERFVP